MAGVGVGAKGRGALKGTRDADISVLHLPHPKYDNMGAMAVTLAQTLGQNLGMMWNKHRSSAGIKGEPVRPHDQPRPTPSNLRSEEGVCGRGVALHPPLHPSAPSQETANVRTTGWAASWKTQGEFLGTVEGRVLGEGEP